MSDWKIFEATATEVLIEHVQNSHDKNVSDNAFLAIMFRFRKDLLNKCERICKGRGYDIEVAQTIAETTFIKYGKTKNFRISEGKHDSIDLCFKLYLYAIASNELKNYYRLEEKRKDGKFYDGTENIVTEIPHVLVHKLSDEDKIIHEAILSLPKSHQIIYLTYKTHEKEGVNLPKELQMKLRKHLGNISQNTVRAYKKVANDKIESAKEIIKRLS